jgi:hypothetical protein
MTARTEWTNPFIYEREATTCTECGKPVEFPHFVQRRRAGDRGFKHYLCDDPDASTLWAVAREDIRQIQAAGHKTQVSRYYDQSERVRRSRRG